MRRLLLIPVLVSLVAVGLSWPEPAAATNNFDPKAQYGALTLTAGVATLVPAAPLPGRQGIQITNPDSANIFCGSDALVTVNNAGIVIFPNGVQSIAVGYMPPAAAVTVYCISAAGTVANGLRYFEVL